MDAPKCTLPHSGTTSYLEAETIGQNGPAEDLSVIIPTYNRPKEIQNCIESLLQQKPLPKEIIVVDDGNLPDFPLRRECESAGIRCVYHKKARPGLTESRNAGIRLAQGKYILFLDDDVVLLPGYFEGILRLFSEDTAGELGGISAIDVHPDKGLKTLGAKVRYLYDVLVLNSGFREGKVLPSGFCVEYGSTLFPIKKTAKVDYLMGAGCSFRREVFEHFSFSEDYKGYGLGEDKDFSFRVGQRFKLVIDPGVRLIHFESLKNRYGKGQMGKAKVLARYRFFSAHLSHKRWRWIPFWYAMAGYVLARTIIMAFSFDRNEFHRVKSILNGIGQILAGKVNYSD